MTQSPDESQRDIPPGAPAHPVGPVGPVGPSHPVNPSHPVGHLGPSDAVSAVDTSAPSAPAAPSAGAPLRGNVAFRYTWFGDGCSLFGTATTTLLLPLVAINEFDAGPWWMGVFTALSWLPWLVIGLPAGAWVDRRPPRRTMIVSDLFSGVTMASVPIAAFFGVLTLTQLLVVTWICGVCSVFFRAAYPTLLTRVVREEDLETANSRLVTTESVMDVLGPSVGGVLAQVLGAARATGLDALTFFVSAFCLWRVKLSSPDTAGTSDEEALMSRIRAGVRLVWRDRFLRFFVVQGGVSNLGLTGYSTLLVLYLVDDLGMDSFGVGLVMAVGSLGGVAGAALAPTISRRLGSARGAIWLMFLGGPPSLLIAAGYRGAWTGVALVVLGLFAVSFCVLAENVIRGSWRQRYVPSELLARTITTSQVVNFGTLPVAGLLAGWLGTLITVRGAIVVFLVIHTLASCAVIFSPVWGHRDLPSRPA